MTCSIMITVVLSFFFFNDTATTEIYTLSLHDALPISRRARAVAERRPPSKKAISPNSSPGERVAMTAESRSEEHTSELQSLTNLVCRLLLEKKKMIIARENTALPNCQS